MTRALNALILAVLVAGCSSSSELDTFAEGAATPDADALIRLDVYPPADIDLRDGRGNLLTLRPQTFYVDAEPTQPADLHLTPAVSVTGRVEGAALTPWAAQSLPVLTGPLADAQVRFSISGGVQQPRTQTDSDGLYDLLVVPDRQEYEVAIIPASAAVASQVLRVIVDGTQRFLDVDLAPGVPVWGFVFDSSGRPLVDAQIQAISSDGLAGPTARTDSAGRYLLAVTQNTSYTLVSLGRGPLDPTVRVDAGVIGEDGGQIDIPYGDLSPRGTITGSVRAPSGNLVGSEAVRVRVVATELASAEGTRATFVREIGTDDGIFTAVVPPGTYRVEIHPQAEDGPAPLILSDIQTRGEVSDLGPILLQALAVRTIVVTDPSMMPVIGAQVACTEQGFAGRTWTSIVGPDGRALMTSPEVPMVCQVSPPGGRADLALARHPINEPLLAELDQIWELPMVEGVVITGTVSAATEARLDAPSSVMVAGALVEVRDANERLLGVGVTSVEGRFQLRAAR